MSELTELRSADAYCRYLANRHYENFSVLSFVLPSSIRLHLTRIYAFCRTTDDLGDESKDDGLERLAQWRSEVEACFAGGMPIHPVLIALRETIAAVAMPAPPFLDLIEANIQDQTVHAYRSWDELHAYCMLSAAPVGRMVLRVFDSDSEPAQKLSDDVCIGLQLANHAQDVRRDGAIGRCYLLSTVVESAGIAGGVRDLADRADQLLESGRKLESMVPFALRVQLALYRLGGQAIVRSIRSIDYRTDLNRPTVSTWEKLGLLGSALGQSMSRWEHATPRRAA